MERFKELLAEYRDGILEADGRTELAHYLGNCPECRDAFVDLVSQQRIRRLMLERV